MSENKQLQFIKGSAILVLSNLVIKGINFLLLPLYTKYLTPEALGISDSITTLTSMVFPLLVMGLDSAFSAFYFDERTEEYQKKVFGTIWFTLFLAGIVPVLLAAASGHISALLFGTDEYAVLVGIAFVSISMNLWYLPFSILVRMQNRMLLFAMINFTASVTMIALNVIFLSVLHIGVYALILSTACINLLQFVLYVILSRTFPKPREYDGMLIRRMLKYSLPLVPNVVAVWILNMSDRYMILYFCGEGDVGLYGIATRFATMVSFVANGVYMAYTTYAYDKKDDADAPKQYARILNAFHFAVVIICITGSVFGKELTTLMTEDSYTSAYLMLAPLLYSQLLYGINTIAGYAIGFVKKSQYILLATCIGAGINIGLNIILVPMFGVTAAAYTTLVSFLLMTAATYRFAQRLYHVEYSIGKIFLTGMLTFVVSIGVQEIPFGFKVITWVLLCCGMMLVFRAAVKDYISIARRVLKRG